MMKVLLLCLCACYAAAFTPVVTSRAASSVVARSSDAVMAAKKPTTKKGKGVNPALFKTGIAPKVNKERGAGRKSFRNTAPSLKAGAAAGMWVAGKPWLEANKRAYAKVSPFQQLAASLGSKEGRGGGAGVFFLGGGRSRKPKGQFK